MTNTPDYIYQGKDDPAMGWDPKTRILSADCSDVFGPAWRNVAYIKVAETGNVRQFTLTHAERDVEGDVEYYDYISYDAPATTLRLFND